jgi:hypothetical protein
LLTSQSPFNLAARRARRLLDRIERKIQRGELPTQAQFLAELLSGIQQFAASLHEPSMEVRRMGRDELLIREHLTDPLESGAEDLELSFEQISLLRDLTRQTFNVCLAEQAGLRTLFLPRTPLSSMPIGSGSPTATPVSSGSGTRSTTSARRTRAARRSSTPWRVTVSLPPTDKKPLSDRVQSITIDRELSAGGLPGNNLEIRQPGREAGTGDRKEPRPVLYSTPSRARTGCRPSWTGSGHLVRVGAGLPSDPPARGSRRACFRRRSGREAEARHRPACELELLRSISRRFPDGHGSEARRLSARLLQDEPIGRSCGSRSRSSLDQPRKVSWLQLTPFLRGQAYPEVEQLLISADGQTWRSLIDTADGALHPRINRGVDFSSLGAAASNFEGVGVWAFPATPIQYVKIVLKQSQSYQTPLGIGHRFYLDRKGKKRVKGPITVVGSFESKLGSIA